MNEMFESILRENRETLYGFEVGDEFYIFSKKVWALDNANEDGVDKIYPVKLSPSAKIFSEREYLDEMFEETGDPNPHREDIPPGFDGSLGYMDEDPHDYDMPGPRYVIFNQSVIKKGRPIPVFDEDKGTFLAGDL